MPHRIYEIKNLMGEADNQPSRLTDRPILVRGRYTRVGGITPAEIITGHTRPGNELIGYDWLGASAYKEVGGSVWLYYSQNLTTMSFVPTNSAEFYPGGAVVEFDTDRVLPVRALFVNTSGAVERIRDTCVNLNLVVDTSSGDWPAGTCVSVLVVFFARGLYGWVPFAVKYASATSSSSFRLQYELHTYPCVVSCEILAKIYVAYVSSSTSSSCSASPPHDRFMESGSWFLFAEEIIRADGTYTTHPILSDDVGEPNARPTFYVGLDHRLLKYSKRMTYANSRVFGSVLNTSIVDGYPAYGYQFKYDCIDACGSGNGFFVKKLKCTANTSVYYSDPDYIGYSDSIDPQIIRFTDVIDAVAPSTRGIYAASSTVVYEAFGDFETLGGTSISMVPIISGVDTGVVANVAFSGDIAYFVKNNEIYKLGPGGKRVLGVQVHKPGVRVHSINYDRYNDQLMAVFHSGELLAYDATRDAWRTLRTSIATVDVPVITRAKQEFRIGDVVYSVDDDPYWLEVMFEKLDFKLPGVRKRVHSLRIPYIGDLNLNYVAIRPNSSIAWRAGTIVDRGGYYEVRFPSAVGESFDLHILGTTPSRDPNAVINPPLVITYEVREKLYAQE